MSEKKKETRGRKKKRSEPAKARNVSIPDALWEVARGSSVEMPGCEGSVSELFCKFLEIMGGLRGEPARLAAFEAFDLMD